MKNLKVSVVIPVYNEEKVIAQCIKSLLNQTYQDQEIILVDDGSSDKTVEIIKSFPVRLLQQNHQGPGAARNLGASQAKGKILVFVDADMTFDKRFIFDLVKPILLGKAKGTTSKQEYVANWENIWARCWNINEGWAPKRRHRLEGGSALREFYDFIAFATSRRSVSLRKFAEYQGLQVSSIFRALLKSEFDRVGGYTPGGYTDDYSLSVKLNYKSTETEAKFCHNNPSVLSEVFRQAKWIGKRSYKFGLIGFVFALLRSSFPISMVVGVTKAVRNLEPRFLLFKLVYDMGIFLGIANYLFSKRGSK